MDRGFLRGQQGSSNNMVTFGSLGGFGSVGAAPDQTLLRNCQYNSTPLESPGSSSSNHNHNHLSSTLNQSALMQQMQAQRANLNLPVGALAPQEQFQKPKMVPTRQNVTLRRRDIHNLGPEPISPILANASLRHLNPVQYTEPRLMGGRQLFPENGEGDDGTDDSMLDSEDTTDTLFGPFSREAVKASMGSFGERRSPFPYPASSDLHCMEPAEMLCNHLKVLAAFKRMEAEKSRLFGMKKKKGWEKAEDKVPPYEFTPETFIQVNSEASIHALYLLFSSLDRKETDQRFRDCWPVYEKKLEGLFRRVALEWMKQIMNANPAFFRDLRSEALGGLLVNPGGDRFISALSQFVIFVMYSVANQKKELVKQQVLLPPVPSKDPEIINRQVHVLKVRTMQLAELGMNLHTRNIEVDVAVKRRFALMENFSNFISQTGEMYSSRVRNMCSMHPDIFGNPTEEEFQQREHELANLKLMEIIEDSYHDFVKEKLEATLQKRTEEIYRPVSFLQDIMEDYSTIWFILDMDRTNPVTLECDKILPSQLQGAGGEEPSMNAFMAFLVSSINSLISNPYLNSEPPREILEEFHGLGLRFDFLNMLGSRVDELSRLKGIREVVRRAKPRLDARKIRVANIDWTKLSKVQEKESKLWDMTPIRIYDINKPSGRTPGINNFLDLSAASYSSCEQQSSVVKRRGASISKQRRGYTYSSLASADANTPVRNVSAVLHNTEDMPDSKAAQNGNDNLSSTLSLSPTSDRSTASHHQLPVSPIISSMRKSVSFGNTSLDLSRISINNRLSMSSINSFTPNQSSQHLSESHFEDGEEDISSSETDGVDSSAHERVHRLLESIVPNHNRRSQSSFGNGDGEAGDVTIEDGVDISPGSDEVDTHKGVIIGKSPNETDPVIGELSGSLSLLEDWGDMDKAPKGIMDVSHIELFRNSDSDD